jgi:hypothetical protein
MQGMQNIPIHLRGINNLKDVKNGQQIKHEQLESKRDKTNVSKK